MQATTAQPHPMETPEQKKIKVERRNQKLFRAFERIFMDASPANHLAYAADAGKLAQFLSDPRGYYPSARREVGCRHGPCYTDAQRVLKIMKLLLVLFPATRQKTMLTPRYLHR